MESGHSGEPDASQPYTEATLLGRSWEARGHASSAELWRLRSRIPFMIGVTAAVIDGIEFAARIEAGEVLAHDRFLQNFEVGAGSVALLGGVLTAAMQLRGAYLQSQANMLEPGARSFFIPPSAE